MRNLPGTGAIAIQPRQTLLTCGIDDQVVTTAKTAIQTGCDRYPDRQIIPKKTKSDTTLRSALPVITIGASDGGLLLLGAAEMPGQTDTFLATQNKQARPCPFGTACLLADAVLPGMDGVSLITQLRAVRLTVPAVMLTAHGDAAMAVAALKAGASDLIETTASAAKLLACLHQAIKSDKTMLPVAGQRRAAQTQFASLSAFASLTPREHDGLARVLAGQPNKIISAAGGINQRTVENHRAFGDAQDRGKGAPLAPDLRLRHAGIAHGGICRVSLLRGVDLQADTPDAPDTAQAAT